VFAQKTKEGNIWYMEDMGLNHQYAVGADFNFEPPKELRNVNSLSPGHQAALCDVNGDLLFYTSGDSVWNRNHQMMVNGFGLNSSVDIRFTSSVIVPHPGDGQLYYIFKATMEGISNESKGLDYAVVDISGDNGLGAVIKKEFDLLPSVSPLLSVVNHADDKSYWLIAHSFSGNLFYALHITESGIEGPVISIMGSVFDLANGFERMQMKISPDGTKLGVVRAWIFSPDDGFVDLYDFNSQTGVVSNLRSLTVPSSGGIEFSSDSELLYLSTRSPTISGSGISQFDISNGGIDEIINSEIQIGVTNYGQVIGMLQLGPDGKIYGGRAIGYGKSFPSVINEPNLKGTDCGFINDSNFPGVLPAPLRFPLSVQSIFRESPSVPAVMSCKGMNAQIRVTSLGYTDSLHWDFGDGTEKSFASSTGKIVNHVYEQTGEYTLRVKKYIGDLSRELVSKVTVIEKPVVDIGADTILCRGDKLLLDGGIDGIKFTWSTGEATPQIEVSDENQYQVIVDNGVCTTTDIISVGVYDYPVVELGPDKIICDHESITLSAPFDANFGYQWNSGSTLSEISVSESGLYELTVSRGRCATIDQINVQFAQIIFSLSETEIEVPFGEELSLVATGTNMEAWHWNFGDGLSDDRTSPIVNHSYLKSGEYNGQVIVTNQFGCSADLFFRVIVPKYLFIPNVVTPNNDNKNDFFEIQYNGDEEPNLMIYNRWGKPTFYSQSFESKWSAEGSDPGVYFYELKLGRESYKGWIQVIK